MATSMKGIWLLVLLPTFVLSVDEIVEYKFYRNYNTIVNDSSGSNDGVKPAPGTASAVNTPYGLYLDGQTVVMPPNSEEGSGSSNVFNSENDNTFNIFVRYLPGATGTFTREILTLKSSSQTRVQLRQKSASESAAPVFELLTTTTTNSADIVQSTSYALSKVYSDKWYFFTVYYNRDDSSVEICLCINSIQISKTTYNSALPKDSNNNYLNGANTKAIYYSFTLYDNNIGCGFEFDSQTIFDISGSCNYVCPHSSTICDVDSYNFDTTCVSCDSQCGNYGCVKYTEVCYNDNCPVAYYSDTNCNNCYANSEKSSSSCACKTEYTASSTNPLTCTLSEL